MLMLSRHCSGLHVPDLLRRLLVAVNEGDELGHLGERLRRAKLGEEVDVALAGGLVQLGLAGPAAALERGVVPALPGAEAVLPRHGDQHAGGAEVLPRGGRQQERVRVGVVDRVPPRADEAPGARRGLEVRRVRGLGAHGAPALEVGVQQRHALDPRAAVQAFLPRAQCQVVRDVAAGAVAGQEQAEQVAVLGQPRVRPGRARQHPPERRPGVVVRRRERVLRRQPVVHRHGHHARPGGQRVEVGVVDGRERRLHHERAAVEVDEHGHPGAGAEAREVEPRGDARRSVDGHVAGGDARQRVRRRGHHVGAHQPLHAPVLVLDQERGEVELHLRLRLQQLPLRRRRSGTAMRA
uniref:Uncharacterized protein n=1 Tax=Zea mays TaxID=4577 RepID=A0A804QB90_MAIZE